MNCIDCVHFWVCKDCSESCGCGQFLDEKTIQKIRHAEWITDTITYSVRPSTIYVRKMCTGCCHKICHDAFEVDEWEKYKKDNWNPETSRYCPNCGAKMDLRELYEQYKLDWCEARGYILDDIDESVGINGECYACFDEWYKNEYLEAWG